MSTPNAKATPEAAPLNWREADAVLLASLLGAGLYAIAGLIGLLALVVLALSPILRTEPEPHVCATQTDAPPWLHYVELHQVGQTHWFRRVEDYQKLVDGGYVPSAMLKTLASDGNP